MITHYMKNWRQLSQTYHHILLFKKGICIKHVNWIHYSAISTRETTFETSFDCFLIDQPLRKGCKVFHSRVDSFLELNLVEFYRVASLESHYFSLNIATSCASNNG